MWSLTTVGISLLWNEFYFYHFWGWLHHGYTDLKKKQKHHQCHQCDGLWDAPFFFNQAEIRAAANCESPTYPLSPVAAWPFQIQSKLYPNYCYCSATLWKKDSFHLAFVSIFCFDSSRRGSLQMDCLAPRSTEPVIHPHLYDQWKGQSRTRRHLEGVIIRPLFPRCNFPHPHIMVPPPPNKHARVVVAGK